MTQKVLDALDDKRISPSDRHRIIAEELGLEIFEVPVDADITCPDGSMFEDGWYVRECKAEGFWECAGPYKYDDLIRAILEARLEWFKIEDE